MHENSEQEQERRLEQREYTANEDIFNQEEHIPIDGDGKPIFHEDADEDTLDKGLDIPGTDREAGTNDIGEDEENSYWGLSDNDDDHEEQNDDLMR
ncbi:hypothetical protein MKJ01_06065 [Chryseobacterium sp. SSA4.19]|uniref:hypothetical protein n=1 Tax=Chryseobacterium sp. SSA4.19 TaxID=2919915 RepID=UPI001F4D881C|nr:hypothetical protein [Chryseobacterium sp. SSA4.19]MCJ8153325.1 hypothetical protein [Chryseobacterium sp. SSA4.19]